MSSEEGVFGESYYSTTYRDYFRQNPSKKLEFYRSIINQHLPPGRPVRLLDIGCGLGGFLACVRASDPDRMKFELTGVDVSQFAIVQNSTTYRGETFEVCSAEHVADLGQTFDIVTAFDVLEHLSDPDLAAVAISTALSRNGAIVLVVPVYDGPLGPLVRVLDKDESHVQLRSREWWIAWANSHFRITGWLGIFRMLTPWQQYIHLPTRALKRVAPAILITAQRKQRHPA